MAKTDEDEKKRIKEEFESAVMQQQEKLLLQEKRIKIIPETNEACIIPDFKFKIRDDAHIKKYTDKIVEYSREYEKEYPSESYRYDAEVICTKKVLCEVLLNQDNKPFTDMDFEKWANTPSVGLGALIKLSQRLYIFLVVQGGKVGLGY